VWGLRYIDECILRDKSGGARLYALQDANWNVDALVDTSGAVVERFSYSAYGVPAFLNPNFTAKAGSDYAWEVLYAGYKWDRESGMYQVRFRYLVPRLGSWGSVDPVGYGDIIANLYLYCETKPVNCTDSSGLLPVPQRNNLNDQLTCDCVNKLPGAANIAPKLGDILRVECIGVCVHMQTNTIFSPKCKKKEQFIYSELLFPGKFRFVKIDISLGIFNNLYVMLPVGYRPGQTINFWFKFRTIIYDCGVNPECRVEDVENPHYYQKRRAYYNGFPGNNRRFGYEIPEED
jgi:RHS repeat-associated protein